MSKDEKSKIIEKIGKVMALAEGGSTQGEREAAAAKLKELMDRYAITHADLRANELEAEDQVFMDELFCYTGGLRSYMRMLVHITEEMTNTRSLWREEKRPAKYRGKIEIREKEVVYIFGTQPQVRVAKKMYEILLSQMHKEARSIFGPTYNHIHRSFLDGCCDVLWVRVKKIEKAQSEETALVVRSHQDWILDEIKAKIPGLQITKYDPKGENKKRHRVAELLGREYGASVDIGTENRIEEDERCGNTLPSSES